MDIIVHRIRLRDGISPERFEKWVTEADYAACPNLTSVVSFSVQRIAGESAGPVEYFEVITVTGRAEFGRDMATPVFRELESGFSGLAEVVDELAGERIGLGYQAG